MPPDSAGFGPTRGATSHDLQKAGSGHRFATGLPEMRSAKPQFGHSDPMLQGAHRLLRARVEELRARDADQAGAELEELERALARMADGTWGNCEGCSGAIGRDRLRAIPETRRCMHCATEG